MLRPFDPVDHQVAEEQRVSLETAQNVPVPDSTDDSGLLGHGRVNGDDNVHAAYAAHLCMENAAHRGYQPNFVLMNSKAIQQAHRRRWQGTCVEIQTDWLEKDLQHLREAAYFISVCVHA